MALAGGNAKGKSGNRTTKNECPGSEGQDQSSTCLKITPATMWRMFWRWSRLLAGKPATGESCCLEMMEAWVRFQDRCTSATDGMGSLDGSGSSWSYAD